VTHPSPEGPRNWGHSPWATVVQKNTATTIDHVPHCLATVISKLLTPRPVIVYPLLRVSLRTVQTETLPQVQRTFKNDHAAALSLPGARWRGIVPP
jgi:hypothetical protein